MNTWIKGLVAHRSEPYLDHGANGGAARTVTGPDAGEGTRLDTRPTTRPGSGNVPGAGVSAGTSTGLSTGSDTGTGRGSSSVGAVSLSAFGRRGTNRGDRRDPRDRGASAAPLGAWRLPRRRVRLSLTQHALRGHSPEVRPCAPGSLGPGGCPLTILSPCGASSPQGPKRQPGEPPGRGNEFREIDNASDWSVCLSIGQLG